MTVQASGLLIATAAFPLLASIGVLLTTYSGHRRLSTVTASVGFAGGIVFGAILAILLATANDADSSAIRVPLWTWFSFSLPQSVSVTFGLEATLIKAGSISLFGAFCMIAVWNANSNTKERLSDETLLATSLLYAAGTIFVLAPNMAQSLLGWGAVSFLAVILMRLSHRQSRLLQSKVQDGSSRTGTAQASDVAGGNLVRKLQTVGSTVTSLERLFVDHIWHGLTHTFPNWLGELAEDSQIKTSVTLQQLVTVLGAAAILLTWLL